MLPSSASACAAASRRAPSGACRIASRSVSNSRGPKQYSSTARENSICSKSPAGRYASSHDSSRHKPNGNNSASTTRPVPLVSPSCATQRRNRPSSRQRASCGMTCSRPRAMRAVSRRMAMVRTRGRYPHCKRVFELPADVTRRCPPRAPDELARFSDRRSRDARSRPPRHRLPDARYAARSRPTGVRDPSAEAC